MTSAVMVGTAVAARRVGRPRWLLVAGLELVFVATTTSLAGLFDGSAWWFLTVFVGSIVFVTAAALRSLRVPAAIASLGAAVVASIIVFMMFGGVATLDGVVPTSATLSHITTLLDEGYAAALHESAPTGASEVLFLVALGALALAFLLDVLAARLPALCGLPVALVLTVPIFILNDGTGLFPLAYCAAAYAFLLVCARRSMRPASGDARSGLVVTSISIVVALLVSATAPAFEQVGRLSFGSSGLSLGSGVNSLVDIGKDLNRPISLPALTYKSSSDDPPYLRLTSLEQFSGAVWKHRQRPTSRLHEGSPLPDVRESPDIPIEKVTSDVRLGVVTTPWLPVPYTASAVKGLDGTWAFDAADGTVVGVDTSAAGQTFTAVSSMLTPTEEQLRAATGPLSAEAEYDLRLPEGVPDSVIEAAYSVTKDAPTHFDQAMALQDFFQSGDFVYTLDAPTVSDRKNGMDVIARFLEDKRGYCVHFASAMAIMARVLDIPSRIALGYLPGSPGPLEDGRPVYSVTSADLHAWPELYFPGVGWVAFEPTVSRAEAATFESENTGNSGDERDALDSSTTDQAAPIAPIAPAGGSSDSSGGSGAITFASLAPMGIVLALGIALFAPAVVRESLRRKRLAKLRAGEGDAWLAWRELRDTARDLGWLIDETETPRGFAERISQPWNIPSGSGPSDSRVASAGRSLRSLRERLEHAAYGPDPARTTPAVVADELAVVLAVLFDTASRSRRVRATMLPASLVPVPHRRVQAARTRAA